MMAWDGWDAMKWDMMCRLLQLPLNAFVTYGEIELPQFINDGAEIKQSVIPEIKSRLCVLFLHHQPLLLVEITLTKRKKNGTVCDPSFHGA